ncbi:MAG TPA: phosphatase PAP2 family protein [Mycobacterium sp.]|nr:phosphatase PAP2 family protein [Mycobacterium sp.]
MPSVSCRPWLADAKNVDLAVYSAIAQTPTPALDQSMKRVSNAANNSVLWFAVAVLLALIGRRPGRRAAVRGLASIAVTSPLVNLAAKRAGRRPRPAFDDEQVSARHVRMPTSHSFPSGHAASAFAFSTGVGSAWPVVAVPLHAAAGVVAYSRVHTGVHYPGDVVVGSVLGTVLAQLTTHAVDRYERRSRTMVERPIQRDS